MNRWVALAATCLLLACGRDRAPAVASIDLPAPVPAPDATAAAPAMRPVPPPLPALGADDRPAPPSADEMLAAAARWSAPLAPQLDALRARADAGDMEAAAFLGRRLRACADALRSDTPAALEREHAGALADRSRRGDVPAKTREHMERRLEDQLARHADCSAVGADAIATGLDWLEKAGRAGDADARMAFAADALDYPDRGALIADIETAGRRGALARAWIEQGVVEGDESALAQMVASLATGDGPFPRDPARHRAYAYAQQLVQSRRTGQFEALWRDGPARYGETTPAEWDEATRRGRDLFRTAFAAKPAWRQR